MYPIEDLLAGWWKRNGCKSEGNEPICEGDVRGESVRKRSWWCGEGGGNQEVPSRFLIGISWVVEYGKAGGWCAEGWASGVVCLSFDRSLFHWNC